MAKKEWLSKEALEKVKNIELQTSFWDAYDAIRLLYLIRRRLKKRCMYLKKYGEPLKTHPEEIKIIEEAMVKIGLDPTGFDTKIQFQEL